jgi:prepilin-type processing-associated H-X9-DG protein
MTNGIIGSSIVPNGYLSPMANFKPFVWGSPPWPFDMKARVHQLEGSPAETLICIDANDIGVRCWSENWRSGYIGEYADPMFRHGSSYRPTDNVDQGWWEPWYTWGPPADLQPRGDGAVNVGMLDGHVETMDEATMSTRWEAGEINYALE